MNDVIKQTIEQLVEEYEYIDHGQELLRTRLKLLVAEAKKDELLKLLNKKSIL